jgi:hypothetical protein
MAIQDAGSISEEVFKAKAPYLIPTEGSSAGTLECRRHIASRTFALYGYDKKFIERSITTVVSPRWAKFQARTFPPTPLPITRLRQFSVVIFLALLALNQVRW